MLRISIKKGKKETTYTMLHEYPKMWNISLSNNIGRLSQGIVDVVGNNTTAFIPHHLVQKGKSGIHKHGMWSPIYEDQSKVVRVYKII